MRSLDGSVMVFWVSNHAYQNGDWNLERAGVKLTRELPNGLPDRRGDLAMARSASGSESFAHLGDPGVSLLRPQPIWAVRPAYRVRSRLVCDRQKGVRRRPAGGHRTHTTSTRRSRRSTGTCQPASQSAVGQELVA